MKLLSGVIWTIPSSPHGGEDFGLGRQGWVAVRTGEEVGIRSDRARMIEGWIQQCESIIVVGPSFP